MNSPLLLALGAALTTALASPDPSSPIAPPPPDVDIVERIGRAEPPTVDPPPADADRDPEATKQAPIPATSRREGLAPEDVSDTRLMIGSTARALGRGEVYLDVLTLFFPSVQVGLSDRVSVGVGTAFVPFVVAPGQAMWFTPKVQVFRGRRTQAAIGLIHAAGFGAHSGLAYGVITRGSSDAAVTVGVGVPYVDGRVNASSPSTLIGGERRINARVKVISENYVMRNLKMFSGGVRIVHRRRTADFQAIAVPGSPNLGGMFRLTYRLRDPKPRL